MSINQDLKDCCGNCHYFERERSIWKNKNGSKLLIAPCYLTKDFKTREDSCERILRFPVVGKIL